MPQQMKKVYAYLCVCMWACVYMYRQIQICICLLKYMLVHVYMNSYICLYVCLNIHIWTYRKKVSSFFLIHQTYDFKIFFHNNSNRSLSFYKFSPLYICSIIYFSSHVLLNIQGFVFFFWIVLARILAIMNNVVLNGLDQKSLQNFPVIHFQSRNTQLKKLCL